MAARKKGTGRIFARGGMWYFRYRNGSKEITRTTGVAVGDDAAKSRLKAEAWAKETDEVKLFAVKDREMRLILLKHMVQTTAEELKERLSAFDKNETLAQLGDLFNNSPRRIDCSAGQLETYLRYCEELQRFLGNDRRIVNVGDAEAESFAKHLVDSGRSHNTYNKYLNGLAVIWNAISPALGIMANPWKSLPRKKLDGRRREIFADEEIDRILTTATGEIKTLITIGLYTGMRLGDCATLKTSSLEGDTIAVTTSKTGAQVKIPIHPALRQSLAEAHPKDGYFLPELAGRYLAGKKMKIVHQVKVVLEKCGIETSYRGASSRLRPLRGFHSLRHTFISRCVSAGIPLHIVQALVGHASSTMTEHYTHLQDRDFLESFGKLK